jgi:hypothetical protein
MVVSSHCTTEGVMGKKDKITLALRNKQRLKNAASALRMQYSELVDLA